MAIPVYRHELAYGTVEIPAVVRQFLMIEFEIAGVEIEADNGRGI
jgi:hypothetical protein